MATKEGSFITIPSPRTYTSVLAVPRSMARSLEKNPARRLISIQGHPDTHDRGMKRVRQFSSDTAGSRFGIDDGTIPSGRSQPALAEVNGKGHFGLPSLEPRESRLQVGHSPVCGHRI